MRSPVALVAAALLSCAVLAPVRPARACGPEMPIPALADNAAQVVIAEVRSVRSYWVSDPRRIETEIVLGDVEYLKGGYEGAEPTLTLTVPGGTVGQWQMRLCCAPEYKVGERWALFILPTCKVHPIVGMERGSFRIERDAQGVERVRTADGRAIVGIDPTGMLLPASSPHAHEHPPRPNEQAGVRMVEPGADRDAPAPRVEQGDGPAMTAQAFRAAIAPTLAGSKDFNLRGPAGRRVQADHRAVPVKRAPGGADEGSKGATP